MSKPPSRFARAFPHFSLRGTRSLWAFALATVMLGFAALNTGNNALYIILSLTLGAFVASGYLSRHTLRSIRVVLSARSEIYAGAPVRLLLEVSNRSSWLPAAGVMCHLVGLPGGVLVPTIPPRGRLELSITTVFGRRGDHGLPAVQVEARLPLAFFVKIVRWEQENKVLVYPRIVRGTIARWAGIERILPSGVAGRGRRGGDVEYLREFRPGDDRRDIHWKQTARQQRLIVMERRERPLSSRFLVLDRQLPRRGDAGLLDRFEDLISELASAVVQELHARHAVGVVIGSSVIPPSTGGVHARRILISLARVSAVGPGEDPLPASVREEPAYRLVEGL